MMEEDKRDPGYVSLSADISDLKVKFARLEERQNSLEKTVDYLKGKIESIDNKVWYILSAVIASILLQILLRLI
jgi:cell division protein FtsB